jgi:hypothetical protein
MYYKGSLLSLFVAITIAMLGHTIHGSFFWSVVDFFFWPLALMKWLVLHELTLNVIKKTFSWFF